MITICMTNGGAYSNGSSINGRNVSERESEVITEILEEDKFVKIISEDEHCILRVSCISSINLAE